MSVSIRGLYTFKSIEYVVEKLKRSVGFKGRSYLLRHLAKKLLKECGDPDLVEFLMGHRGGVSKRYDSGHFLAPFEIEQYKRTFLKASKVMQIYHAPETLSDADEIVKFAESKGVDAETLRKMYALFNTSKMSIAQLLEILDEIG